MMSVPYSSRISSLIVVDICVRNFKPPLKFNLLLLAGFKCLYVNVPRVATADVPHVVVVVVVVVVVSY